MKAIYTLAMAILLIAPAAGHAQDRGGPPPGEMRERMGNPLGMLLERREALGLSADQVTRLEAISVQLEANNRAIMERMEELRDQAAADRREMRETMRPLMESMRQNTENAMEQVRDVLTDEQQERMREFAPRGGRMGDRDRPMRGDRPGAPPRNP